MKNPLLDLAALGQSVWYDFIRKSLIESGDLARLVEDDAVKGVTSNPSIFEAAIAKSDDYDAALGELDLAGSTAEEVYEALAIADIQAACDVLRPVYESTAGDDGFVSLEVSPDLGHDTEGTLAAARRLWGAVDRPNLMIKVPATEEGIPAIQTLIREGIHVNVTLLFARSMYERVAEAYIAGLEERAADGGDVGSVRSVASFFVSRIDSKVDALLRAGIEATVDPRERALRRGLIGKAAIANAKVTFAGSRELFGGGRWEALSAAGAKEQRLLWASTSTKDPSFCDVLYVEELIGPNTVNTVPAATVDAFRDHGRARASLEEDLDGARDTLAALPTVGVDLDAITADLLAGGVQAFVDAYARLLEAVEQKRLQKVGG
ncbi:MAG: transaldolase [Planctomycetes bacterium]|nr:transaldolase [Planctomycetota bacterium]MDA0947237.1 transaldolase [Planctomycetota bacterium]